MVAEYYGDWSSSMPRLYVSRKKAVALSVPLGALETEYVMWLLKRTQTETRERAEHIACSSKSSEALIDSAVPGQREQ